MIEVEAKVAISNPADFRILAKKIGKYAGNIKKVDDYYTLQGIENYPKKSLRIRKMNGFYIINFKRRISYADEIHAKKETEFKASNLKGFLALIEDFGFKKWLTKEKETELYKIKDNFHIELNKVKNLGRFIEVEYLVNNEKEINKARKEIFKVLKELNISKKELTGEGYTKMLWNRGFVKRR